MNIESDYFCAARSFIASLYDQEGKHQQCHNSLNGLRYELSLKKTASIAKLPPSEKSFKEHIKRATVQASVWMQSHIANHEYTSPVGNGWEMDHEKLAAFYFEGNLHQKCLMKWCVTAEEDQCAKMHVRVCRTVCHALNFALVKPVTNV